ncbi:MAG: hypothetical protein H0X46_00095 [Bacteroidetes bacterium]|nr:hypothetical protein [Bacteroidota bacterium]
MADCSNTFLKFNTAISLNKTDRKYLRSARKAVTGKIRTYFEQNSHCPKVEFIAQGSFTMGTIVKPLSGDYDIDIGVYLRELSDYQSGWPTPEAASKWLINALQNHTSTSPINKKTCVRIIYQPITKDREVAYHVDLPIYVQYLNFWDNKRTRIGIIGETQWSDKSDPVGFTKWFIEKCQQNDKDKNQLIRLIKYIKAWKDFKGQTSKFPSGMVLTVLLAENYKPNDRDDLAFYETIRKAYNSIDGLFVVMCEIYKPVEPYNDLTEKLNSNQKKVFMKCFEELVDDGKLAIEESNQEKSMLLWCKHFDSRFNN